MVQTGNILLQNKMNFNPFITRLDYICFRNFAGGYKSDQRPRIGGSAKKGVYDSVISNELN